MKAIVYSHYGSPDVLEITDISKPIPNERQVLFCVVASAVNTADVRTRLLSPAFYYHKKGSYHRFVLQYRVNSLE